jgi:hypothetical protein
MPRPHAARRALFGTPIIFPGTSICFPPHRRCSRGLHDHLGAIPESEATTDQNFSVELRTALLAIG